MISIQVLGTNGKGTVCAHLASALSQHHRCGVFTSPHLQDIRERISIHHRGEVSFIESLPPIVDINRDFALLLSYAVDFFQGCSVCVFEAGLGGRLDPTTTLHHQILILTQISMDHMALLGDTLEKIASEKAAAIQQGQLVICAPQERQVLQVIEHQCKTVGAKLIVTKESGAGLPVNRELARVCAMQLGIKNPDFSGVNNPARLEKRGNKLFDVCHNVASVKLLVDHLNQHYGDSSKTIHIAVMKDKDYLEMAKCFCALKNFTVDCVHLEFPRVLAAKQLEQVFADLGLSVHNKSEPELHVYCGSFALVAKYYMD